MKEFRLIVAGTRYFNDYDRLKACCDAALKNVVGTHEIVIVSGKAKGADTMGEWYAQERGYRVAEFPADWNSLGKKAGMIRNREMRDYALQSDRGGCIAFWDSESHGTKGMMELCKQGGLPCIVSEYTKYNDLYFYK